MTSAAALKRRRWRRAQVADLANRLLALDAYETGNSIACQAAYALLFLLNENEELRRKGATESNAKRRNAAGSPLS